MDHSGPFPATPATLEVDGVTADAWAEGRDTTGSPVGQPRLTEGTWVEDGGVVVEAAFADALGVGAGDRVTLNGRSFRVVGVAVTAAASYTDVCFGTPCGPLLGVGPDDVSGSPPPGRPERSGAEGRTIAVDVEPLPDDPGLVWLTRDDARGLAPAEAALSHVVNLELADPASAAAFVEAHSSTGRSSPFLAS